jgi:hypothetical protein
MIFSIGGSAGGGRTDVDVGTIYWDDIERLLGLDEEYNRINRGDYFGGWEYDPETKSQNYVARSEGMQAAQDRMDRRLAGEGFEKYEAPSQASAITDALMANRMERMGLLPQGAGDLTQPDYGTRFADRSGSPTAQPPTAPPQGGQPPMPPPTNVIPPQQGAGPMPPPQRPPAGGAGSGWGKRPIRPHSTTSPQMAAQEPQEIDIVAEMLRRQ